MKYKTYKPGQLITINNCVYRIKKHTKPFDWVSLSPEGNPCLSSCLIRSGGIKHKAACNFCVDHLPYSYYLIPI